MNQEVKVFLRDATNGGEHAVLLPAVPRKGEHIFINYPKTIGQRDYYVQQVTWMSMEV